MDYSLVAAVNNETLFLSSLGNSPDIGSAVEVIQQRNFASAAKAYNDAWRRASGTILVFLHQDVYLPRGWFEDVSNAISKLARNDPNWGVLGVWGVDGKGQGWGNLVCTGVGRRLGKDFDDPQPVRTLDELALIVRRDAGFRFDERLAGYHFYGSDLCLEASQAGKRCYAISALCVHNTNSYGMLPWGFWRAFLYLRRKWWRELPIITPCISITKFGLPAIRWNLARAKNILLRRHQTRHRVLDPSRLLTND